MRLLVSILTLAVLLPSAAVADQGKLYRWVDNEGVVHFSDHIPAEYADQRKQLVNEHGVPLEDIAGKKTEEEIEAERAATELALQQELQRRADRALMAAKAAGRNRVTAREGRISRPVLAAAVGANGRPLAG